MDQMKSGKATRARTLVSSYFYNLGAIDLLELGEAVVDPLRVGSPLQQVQHIT